MKNAKIGQASSVYDRRVRYESFILKNARM